MDIIMETEIVQSLTANFEACASQAEGCVEYGLARDLQNLLGYTKWDNFINRVSKAKTACEASGHQGLDHFVDVNKTIQMPPSAEKEIQDLMLTRYAGYLIAQNGDSRKQEIVFAQTDFAVQTLIDVDVFGEKQFKGFQTLKRGSNRRLGCLQK